jgi:hypothetical protein
MELKEELDVEEEGLIFIAFQTKEVGREAVTERESEARSSRRTRMWTRSR